MPQQIHAALGLDSYSCPHCGALAHQYWHRVFIYAFDRDQKPFVFEFADVDHIALSKVKDIADKTRAYNFVKRLEKNLLTFQQQK